METSTNDGYGKLQTKFCKSFEEAQTRAGQEAANTIGFPLPVVVFRQGIRWNLSGALPLSFVASRLESRSAEKKAAIAEVTDKLNRPEDPTHSDAIAAYLKANVGGEYILPPLTLNIQQPCSLYTSSEHASTVMSGFLVIPHSAKLAITDGQHRRSGIIRAIQELDEEARQRFEADGVAVMITCETAIEQIHQDFADCSRTKPLPPSQLAIYDRRNPANKLVLDLESQCPLFKGRIDATSATLGKKSSHLFLANQVRQLVKVLLFGSWQMSDADFERKAVETFAEKPDVYQRDLQRFVELLNFLTESIPVWRQIASLQAGVQSAQVAALREQGYVCMRAVGLVILGKIGHELIRDGEVNWREYATRLGEIDWKATAPHWKNNIVSATSGVPRILTNQRLVREATASVRSLIHWTPKVGAESAGATDRSEDAELNKVDGESQLGASSLDASEPASV